MNKHKWITFTCSNDCDRPYKDDQVYFDLDYYDCSNVFAGVFSKKTSRHNNNDPEYLYFNDEAFDLMVQQILTDCIPSQYLDPNNKDKTGFAINEGLHLWQLISAFELEGIEFVEVLNEPTSDVFMARGRINKEFDAELVFKVYVD